MGCADTSENGHIKWVQSCEREPLGVKVGLRFYREVVVISC